MKEVFKRAVSRLGLTADSGGTMKEQIARYALRGENPTVPPVRMIITTEGVYVRLDDVATLTGPDRIRLRNLLRMMAQDDAA